MEARKNTKRKRLKTIDAKRKKQKSFCEKDFCFWYGQQDLNLHSKESDPKSDASANSAMPAEWVEITDRGDTRSKKNSEHKKRANQTRKGVQLALTWRRRWDSNPRAILLATRFRVRSVTWKLSNNTIPNSPYFSS